LLKLEGYLITQYCSGGIWVLIDMLRNCLKIIILIEDEDD